jgi:phosphinothricin acetyltransferase
MIVRAAAPQDAQAIADLVNPVIRDTAITFTTEEKTPADLAAAIADAPGTYQVAEAAGRIVGYAGYTQFRRGPGYARTMEHSITIAPEARGQGVGRGLMAALEAQARAAGVHALWAGVSAENPPGVAFHRAIGFRQVAVLEQVGFKFGRWMDLVLLQKFL